MLIAVWFIYTQNIGPLDLIGCHATIELSTGQRSVKMNAGPDVLYDLLIFDYMEWSE